MENKEILCANIYKIFFKYVSLNILSMLGLSFYILADTFFIANGVGSDGLTALNLVLPVFTVVNGTGILLGMGGATRFAILKGEKQGAKANAVFTNAMLAGTVLGILFTLAGIFFSDQISALLGADTTILPIASEYIRTLLIYSCAFVLDNILIAFVRNDQSPNLAMAAMLTASFSNILLDYVFVFPMGLGMFGAALATGIAPILSAVVLGLHFIRHKNTFRFVKCRFSFSIFRRIFSLGLPSFITEVSNGIVLLILNLIILGISGNMGVAAYGIVANLSLVAISVFTGTAQGMQPVLSYHFGAGRFQNIRKIYRMGIFTALVLGGTLYLVGLFFAPPIAMLFNRDQNLALNDLAVQGIYLYFTGFLITGINIISISFFSSVEKATQSFVISITRGLLAVIPFVFVLPALFGLTGVWLCVPCAEAVTLVLTCIFARKEMRRFREKPSL